MIVVAELLPFDFEAVRELCRELDEWRLRLDARGALPRRWEGRLRRELEAAAVGASVGLEQVPVTVDEVRRILAGDRPTSVSAEDAALVTGYRDAMSFVLRRADDPGFRWDRELVIGLQDRVLAGRHAEGAGRLRRRTVWLTRGDTGERVFLPPPRERVDALVDEMCELAQGSALHPAALSAWVHVTCAAIHPFGDGNGRTARVLASLAMYRGGFCRPEFTSLEEWWGSHPAGHYAAFDCLGGEFDRHADVTPFVRAHVEAQLSQARALDLKERAEAQIWIAVENVAGARGLRPRVANALWDAFFGREVAAGYYRELADVSAATATNDLAAATAAGLLRGEGERRGRRYTAGPALLAEVATELGVALDAHEGPSRAARAAVVVQLTERLVSADQSRPMAVVVSVWRELEREIEETARERGLVAVEGLSTPVLAERLASVRAIREETAHEVRRLGDLRNRAVHSEGLPVTADEAFTYAREAQRVIELLRRGGDPGDAA